MAYIKKEITQGFNQKENLNFERKDKASSVKLTLSMQPLNVDEKAEGSIHIPSKSDFSFYSFSVPWLVLR